MCTGLFVDGYKVPGLTGLVNLVGASKIAWQPGMDLDDVPEVVEKGTCLCPVDLEATAKRNGFVCEDCDELGNFSWRSRREKS